MTSSPHSVTCLPFTQNPYNYYLKHFAGRDSVGKLRISCNEEESRRVSFLGGGGDKGTERSIWAWWDVPLMPSRGRD